MDFRKNLANIITNKAVNKANDNDEGKIDEPVSLTYCQTCAPYVGVRRSASC